MEVKIHFQGKKIRTWIVRNGHNETLPSFTEIILLINCSQCDLCTSVMALIITNETVIGISIQINCKYDIQL